MSADNCTEEKKCLLETVVEALKKSTQVQSREGDECDVFGEMMAHTARLLPQGPQRQMGILLAHQALVKQLLAVDIQDIQIIKSPYEME